MIVLREILSNLAIYIIRGNFDYVHGGSIANVNRRRVGGKKKQILVNVNCEWPYMYI